ncbi:MAG: TetR/AcrR family transcriptional regulator [Alphaproteobacteria bacterium]|nr:TetR/AcrR family transcriptional regulator [Alphaproteobacteria bacterium]MDE2110483.1 TetR/AcrR family transcriptional regulator [Alphaproteobacteria bacterium]MDE2493233.1 TetR/AcrR family transcriptional regulator [Alphaproteobacteria bacterium]
MARPVDRDAKRLQIVEAAATQFARNGYESTLMDDVAAAAGVSKGSLYDYFENKEDLFYAVFEWLQQKILQAGLARLKPELSAKEQIIGCVESSVVAFVEYAELYPVTLEVWAAAAKTGTRQRFSKAMQALYTQYRSEVEVLIRAAQASGEVKTDIDVKAVAAVLVGAIDGVLLQCWLDPTFAAPIWLRTFLLALFDGIGTEKPRKT